MTLRITNTNQEGHKMTFQSDLDGNLIVTVTDGDDYHRDQFEITKAERRHFLDALGAL